MTALTIPERHQLITLLARPREAPFNRKLLNRLMRSGLVSGEPLRREDGRLSVNYRWTITDKGREACDRGWYD